MDAPWDADVLIVGGGLSGLALADRLTQAGISFHLLEARETLGGRVKTHRFEHGDRVGYFDLGPSWFWPGQPRIQALVKRFGLEVYDQYSSGSITMETPAGQVSRSGGMASMEGSFRLVGGLIELIHGLRADLPADAIHTDCPVRSLRQTEDGLCVAIDTNGQELARARHVVVALPPRVAATLTYDPPLPSDSLQALATIPTWMGGHAKMFAIYDQPFWRDAGYSGDGMSRRGPLVEIHDASDPVSGLGALFGFAGIPPAGRENQEKPLIAAGLQQLGRHFGPEALQPIGLVLQDWAFEPETATQADHEMLTGHPAYGLPAALGDLWEGALFFGATETARQFGGFLEGALEAAERVARQIQRVHQTE